MRIATRPAYPPAPRLDLVEAVHGHLVADPYRPLEDAGGAATKEWPVGAAMTQRPELYAAVVCSAPLLDMARYERPGLDMASG